MPTASAIAVSDTLAGERALPKLQHGDQYALDHTTSCFAGSPVTMHFAGFGVVRNSSSGMQRNRRLRLSLHLRLDGRIAIPPGVHERPSPSMSSRKRS